MKKKLYFAVFVILATYLLSGCTSNPNFSVTKKKVVYVDSVWVTPPGSISTLQFDPIYMARTEEGKIHTSRERVNVGDSFVYIYYTK